MEHTRCSSLLWDAELGNGRPLAQPRRTRASALTCSLTDAWVSSVGPLDPNSVSCKAGHFRQGEGNWQWCADGVDAGWGCAEAA